MSRARRHGSIATALLLTGAVPLVAQDRITLSQLAELARKRYKAVAAQQQEAIQPYLSDLELDYYSNRSHLDKRFELMAQLGDGVVPLLLERLSPAMDGSNLGRTVAENSARVLRRIGPAAFVDPLLEVVASTSYTARRLAIDLLGDSGSQRAARVLAARLPTTTQDELAVLIDTLRELGYADGGAAIGKAMRSSRTAVRLAALQYLAELQPPAARADVLDAITTSPDTRNIELYLRYLRAAAPRDRDAADALVVLSGNRDLDSLQLTAVVRALAEVAPKNHKDALATCRRLLENGQPGQLALACALTMRALGSKAGVDKLLTQLKQQMNKERRNADPYVDRAELYIALEKWNDAVRDLREAVQRVRSSSIKSMLHLRIARCEAHRNRSTAVLRALRDSNQTYAAIQRQAQRDPVFAKALTQTPIRRFLDQLERGR